MSETNTVAIRQNDGVSLAQQNQANADVVALVTKGDLSKLTSEELVRVYIARCDALGLDVRATPFEVISFKGKTTLYPKKECAEQLRRINGISEKIVSETFENDILTVRIRGTDREGREDEEIAALFIGGLRGQELADARMKVVTKAKRRLTLSMCGLGSMAEVDEDDPRILRRRELDLETGEIIEVVDEALDDEIEAKERADALRRYHAAGKDAGLDHDQLRSFAKTHYPTIESLADLDAISLTMLADVVKDAVKNADATTSLIGDETSYNEETYAQILDAKSLKALDGLRESAKEHPTLTDAWRNRVRELGGNIVEKRSAQPALTGAATGVPGDDPHTAR